MSSIEAVSFVDDDGQPTVLMVDQRLLPTQSVWRRYTAHEDVAQAITDMVIRGAPAIGIAAGYGIAQAMLNVSAQDTSTAAFETTLSAVCDRFACTRPTAVNLFWAIERLRACDAANRQGPTARRAQRLLQEARAIHDEDRAACLAMGEHGAALLPQTGGVLTHCNTGALATGGQGTALGVIRSAFAAGKDLHVFIDETRPYLQGSRLTAWECVQDGIGSTLITDNMAASLMAGGHIAAAIVGSDRIAANGDVSNKIGTYGVAVLCRYHGIPFYVAAPTSTIDLDCPSGAEIPIEQRSTREVTHVGGWAPSEMLPSLQVAPAGVEVINPAFDVTPATLVDAIITERGVATGPYRGALAKMVEAARKNGG
jgi:methylthioribose-1-phosphate isomerase